MVTLALLPLFGIVGLAVDIGWNYYIKKTAQAAADAAALAAAQAELLAVGQTAGLTCANATCQAESSCVPSSNNVGAGCLYAGQNGFAAGGHQGAQRVTAAAGVTSPPPTAPGVVVDYWVTVRISEEVPQLFSAVLGNTVARPSARATAAIANTTVAPQLFLLGRQHDTVPGSKKGSTGNDLSMQGGGEVYVYGGLSMASTDSSAARTGGNPTVNAPGGTYMRGSGGVNGTSNFGGAPPWPGIVNGLPDGALFQDPMRGKGQPPAPQNLAARNYGILNGQVPNNSVLPSGNYYAVDSAGKPTGRPLSFGNNVQFQDGNFGNWVLFGGIAGDATFGPGRYIVAGTQTGTLLNWDKVAVKDNAPVTTPSVPPADAGEIFVLTDVNYPGLQIPPALAASPSVLNSLVQGSVLIKSGNSAQWYISLHGLSGSSPSLPPELKPFANVALWQDQANSTITYTANGNIDLSCGGLDTPCANTALKSTDSTWWNVDATPNLHIYGAMYQPRGAGINFQANSDLESPLQIVTGYLSFQGKGTMKLLPMATTLMRRVAALVE